MTNNTTVTISKDTLDLLKKLNKQWKLSSLDKAIIYMIDYFKKTGIDPTEDKFESGFGKLTKRQEVVIRMIKEQEKRINKYLEELKKELIEEINTDIRDAAEMNVEKLIEANHSWLNKKLNIHAS